MITSFSQYTKSIHIVLKSTISKIISSKISVYYKDKEKTKKKAVK